MTTKTTTKPLYSLSLLEAAALVKSGEVSPVDLAQACLGRIAAVEPRVEAFVTLTTELALEQAKAAEAAIQQGEYRGPLHGIPIALKDLYNTKGIKTTSSSKVRADYIPEYDSMSAELLAKAGAVLLGKVTTHEFAYGIVSQPTHNPWDLARIPGGSSGGSGAAVASEECFGAMGSDTGGSIRIPSSFCGIAGIKPTFGRASKYGVAALGFSLDHVGPMTRRVADAAVMLQAVAGYDPRDLCSVDKPVPDFSADLNAGVKGLTLGMPTNYYFDDIDPEVKAAVEAAIKVLEAEGATVKPVTIPYIEYSLAAEFAIVMPEASAYHQVELRQRPELYNPDVRDFLEAGELIPAPLYVKAQRFRVLLKQGFRQAFEANGLDALVVPTLPATAPRMDQALNNFGGKEEPVTVSAVRYSCPANLTGLPAMSLPCGFSSANLPIGLQIIGRPFAEATVLRVAQAYEQVTDWHTRRPPLD